ncbi:LysR family transcriptional regulator [Paenibacillus sp. LjRoot153]|uniref:LysR family transcriptional regulator n=1 Tax=Paenibacillus sp. LjRoot153 TaxID=3342270 RepID=UPI003ECCDE66
MKNKSWERDAKVTLYQLEVFLAVVKTGSFTKAGDLLFASQSGISHIIAGLEKELGVLLFTRNRDGVKLTETGKQISVHAREIVNQTEQIHQLAAEAIGIQSGTIRIGAFPSFSINVIPGIFQAFRKQYPGVELLLFEGSYAEIESWIKASAIDLGFLSNSCDGLEIMQLVRDPLVVVLPTTHPLSKNEVISIEQLEHEPFLLLNSGCESLVISAFQEKALILNTQFEIAENSTIISMVEAGFGVTIVPSMILPVNPENVVVKQLNPPIIREIGLALRSQQIVTPIVDVFIKETQKLLAEI